MAGVETEVIIIEHEEEFIDDCDTLSPENQIIVKMMFSGYRKKEIAEFLEISKPAVSQRIRMVGKGLGNGKAGFKGLEIS